jgi:hypothetical protein
MGLIVSVPRLYIKGKWYYILVKNGTTTIESPSLSKSDGECRLQMKR